MCYSGSHMKLGEALNERARLAKGVSDKRDLIGGSLIIQEGEEAPFDAAALVESARLDINAIATLVAQINATNSGTTLEDGTTLTKALAMRDALGAQYALLDYVLREASGSGDFSRFSQLRRATSELRNVRTLDVEDVRVRRDEIALERRTLDTAIQAANWTTDLIE